MHLPEHAQTSEEKFAQNWDVHKHNIFENTRIFVSVSTTLPLSLGGDAGQEVSEDKGEIRREEPGGFRSRNRVSDGERRLPGLDQGTGTGGKVTPANT